MPPSRSTTSSKQQQQHYHGRQQQNSQKYRQGQQQQQSQYQKQRQLQRVRAASHQPPVSIHRHDEKGRRSWVFTCGVLLVVLFVAAMGGILVWKFLPTGTKSNLQNIVNGTVSSGSDSSSSSSGSGGSGGDKKEDNDSSNNNNNNNNATTETNTENQWSFMQCQDPLIDCCNGLDNGFCDFRINDVMYGLVHNAMASFEDSFYLLYNQNYNLESALLAGYRALELDVSRCGDANEIVFYHGECALGTRNVTKVLENVYSFLKEYPSEIVMLFLQMNGNIVSLNDFYTLMSQIDNGNLVQNVLYSHALDATEWPTLRELVQSNKRLILFYWNQDDCAPGAGGPGCPPGFHYYYRYGVQTKWDFNRISDIIDKENDNQNGNDNGGDQNASCALSYTPNYKNGQQFFRINAFLRLPSSSAAEDLLNQPSFVQQRIDACSMQNPLERNDTSTWQLQYDEAIAAGKDKFYLQPNFYSVDFWEKGSVMSFIQEYNLKLLQAKQFEAANLLDSSGNFGTVDDTDDEEEHTSGATDLDALISANNNGRDRLLRRRRRLF